MNLEKLSDIVNNETILVSMMLVNHEIGTIEPIKEAVETVKEKTLRYCFTQTHQMPMEKSPSTSKS